MRKLHVADRGLLAVRVRSSGRDDRRVVRAMAIVAGALVLGGCGGSTSSTPSTVSSAPGTTAAPVTATTPTTVPPNTTVTTMPAETTPATEPPGTTMPPAPTFTLYTTLPGPETTVPPPVITAPPGRLPPVDDTATITALFPIPFPVDDALSLATETILRLRASFDTTGFSAGVTGLSLVDVESDDQPLGSVMAFVVEVRNQEASGDDSSPGYDLILTLERDDAGNWAITKAARQQICSRGVSTTSDPPLCV